MTGSLQKKKDSKYYYAVINTIDKEGKHKQVWRSTKCTLKKEAQVVLRKFLNEMEIKGGAYTDYSKITFADFMIDWLENVISKQVQITTLDGYTTNVKTHIVPYFKPKKIKLQELKTWQIQQYFDYKYNNSESEGKTGLSVNTLKKQYVNILKALDYAVKNEIIQNNPAKNVTLPKIEKYEAKFLSVEQAEALINATKGTNIETAVFLTIHYGFRRGEILGLRWSDINFKENYLVVQNEITKVTNYVEKKPKSNSSIRKLTLIPKVTEYLKALKITQKKNQLLYGNTYTKNDYVCKYEDGKPLKIATLNHAFKRLLLKNKLPDIRFHDLRHSAASFLYHLGFREKEIQHWLGHANISTTMDIYVHLFKETDNVIAEKMDSLFKNTI